MAGTSVALESECPISVTRKTICAIGSAIEMQQPTMPIDSVTIQTISAAPGLHRVVISRIFRHRSGRFRGRAGPPYRFVLEKEDQAQREHRAHEQDTEQEIRLTPADQFIRTPADLPRAIKLRCSP